MWVPAWALRWRWETEKGLTQPLEDWPMLTQGSTRVGGSA